MPNTREKLIELIRKGRYKAENICNENDDCQRCTIADPDGNCKIGYIADHLIANGVTVQKWIPVTERLPEKSGYCLIIHKSGIQSVIHYSAKSKVFNSFDSFDDDHDGNMHPTHWMPLPEAPKGE